jgi:hypothetical protein
MPAPYTLSFTNGDFETGDRTGWTSLVRVMDIIQSNGGVSPYEGSYMAMGDRFFPLTVYYQDLDLGAVVDAATELDDESLKVVINWQQANSFGTDAGGVAIRFLDASGNAVTPDESDGLEEITPEDTWTARSLERIVPEGARQVRVFMIWLLLKGDDPNVLFDDFSGELQSNDLGSRPTQVAYLAVSSTNDDQSAATPTLNFIDGESSATQSLVLKDGTDPGWDFTFTTLPNNGDGSGIGPLNTAAPGPQSAYTGYVNTDNLTNDSFTFELSGLDTSKVHKLTFSATRASSNGRFQDYEVVGDTTKTSGQIRGDNEHVFNEYEVTLFPDANGKITVTATSSTDDYHYFSALRIEELPGSVVTPDKRRIAAIIT